MRQRAARIDGWTPARRTTFIDALFAGDSVVRAAAAAGMTASTAYRLYRRDPAFAATWNAVHVARCAAMVVPRMPTHDASISLLIRRLTAGKRQGARP